MAMQLSRADTQRLSSIMAGSSQSLTDAHMAYAEGRLLKSHVEDAYKIRDSMISLLADFEDGAHYGAVEFEWRQAMRHFETTASALIAAVQFEDDVRPAMIQAA